MRVLITRPREDGLATAQALHRNGVRSTLEPLFKIIFNQAAPEMRPPYQALLFTSRSGVKAFGYRFPELIGIPAYCIGEYTFEAAQEYGLRAIDVNGDGRDLLARVKQDLKPQNGTLFRAASEGDEDPLKDQLEASGFDVHNVALYRAQALHAFSSQTVALLRKKGVDGVLLFAPRTSAHFVTLVQQEKDLATSCADLVAWCINDLTADALVPLVFRQVRIAPKPTQQALVDMVTADRTLVEGFFHG